VILLIFATTLLIAVMVSGLAHRSVLSTAVLFLVAGFAVGEGALNLVLIEPGAPSVQVLAELALFSILFTDGLRVSPMDLVSAWHLPGRALLLGMPITLGLTALIAHGLLGLPWLPSFLLGTALSPTDPVFAAAIVGREEVPFSLRHLLNVESGLNDGLALPVVILLIVAAGGGHESTPTVLAELVGGTALGVAVPLAALKLERSKLLSPSTAYEPLNAFAIGLLVLAISRMTNANAFLAAFAAGVTLASVAPSVREAFQRFGELVAELLKLAAVLVFGIAVPLSVFTQAGLRAWIFVALCLVLVRPVAIGAALLGARMGRREWLAAAWFGPKGFASVVYGLLILESGINYGRIVFALIALVISVSIVAHSSTDVFVARRFRQL
jgi:NhaP-type Na+/H+ or K+/H+ antiporter